MAAAAPPSSLSLTDPAKLRGALADASWGAWRLTRSTGKAAWIAVSSFLVLVVPLIIELDREQQLVEFEAQQLGALTGGGGQGGQPAQTK
jgi:import receptor subunit TOM22